MQHRVEVLAWSQDGKHESWSNPNGSVIFLRKHGHLKWRAVVDRIQVIDVERMNSGRGMYTAQTCLLEALSAQGLAQLLALQEQLHAILD